MSKERKRLDKVQRREQILNAAVDLARRNGFNKLTRDGIAEHAGVSMGLVTHYFPTMNQLRRDVMRAAVRDEVLPIIAQGLAMGDTHARKAEPELQRRALSTMIRAQ